jgi:hypothetical protein
MKDRRPQWVTVIIVAVVLLAGCPSPRPIAPSQPAPAINLKQQVSDQLQNIRITITYRQCTALPNISPPSASPNGSIVAGIQQSLQPDPYNAWITYVAKHVQSAKPFDATYAQLAQNALSNLSEFPLDQTQCPAFIANQSYGQIASRTTASDVGYSIFNTFSVDDPASRNEVAADLVVR